MNLRTMIFHGVLLSSAATLSYAAVDGWGLADPQRAEKSIREDSERKRHGRGIHGGGVRYGK
jgi:hypothetical protein